MLNSARAAFGIAFIFLLLSSLELLQIVQDLDVQEHGRLSSSTASARFGIMGAVILYVVGSILRANLSEQDPRHTGFAFVQAAWVVAAAIMAMIVGLDISLIRHFRDVSRPSRIYLIAVTSAIPFLTVRIVYGCLGAFYPYDPTWNVLAGSVDAFVGMALVMEWAVAALYLVAGFTVMHSWDNIGEDEAIDDD